MNLDQLRHEIKKLTKERELAILEKGLAAEENKDLRENFAYDYWFEKEMVLTARIASLVKEIEKHAPAKKPSIKHKSANKQVTKIKDLPRNKWL